MNGKCLKAWLKKWRRMGKQVEPWCRWAVWVAEEEEEEKLVVPRDVPKGHLVVYVGECQKRFVIKVALLKHPLFVALLDQAQEAYDFTPHNNSCRLHIPCDENTFLSVVQCAKSPPQRPLLSICL